MCTLLLLECCLEVLFSKTKAVKFANNRFIMPSSSIADVFSVFCGSASSCCWSGSDLPFCCRSRSGSVYSSKLENHNFFNFFYSNAYLHCFIIYRYLSHQCHRCYYLLVFWTEYWNFLEKKDSLSLHLVKIDTIRIRLPGIGSAGPWHLSRSGYRSSKMMAILPDSDPYPQ